MQAKKPVRLPVPRSCQKFVGVHGDRLGNFRRPQQYQVMFLQLATRSESGTDGNQASPATGC